MAGKLVFSSTAITGNQQIYAIKTDGTGLTNLTNDDRWNPSPLVSPDRKKIAFLSSDVRDSLTNIYVMDADGKGRNQLTKDGFIPGAVFVWSPDSSMIAFEGSVQHQQQISVVDVDGSVTPLTEPDNVYYGSPAWSSNNTVVFERISFDEYHRPADSSLVEMNVEGGSVRTLIEYRENTGNYVLSPDSSRIAFVEAKEAPSVDFDFIYSIHVMDVDGGNSRQLAGGFVYLDFDFRWSPDSRQMAFQGHREYSATSRIYLATLDRGGAVNTITDTDTNESHPVWSPTGRLAFIKDVGEHLPAIHVTDTYPCGYQEVSEIGYPFSAGSVGWLE